MEERVSDQCLPARRFAGVKCSVFVGSIEILACSILSAPYKKLVASLCGGLAHAEMCADSRERDWGIAVGDEKL